jgi:hypothetical protein
MKKNIYRLILMIIPALAGGVFMISCQKSADVKTKKGKPEVELFDAAVDSTGNRFARLPVVHLKKDTVYLLNQDFIRHAGEQLIIDEGTLIKVSTPSTNTGPSITIEPGGSITAVGNATEPIVFTSNARAGTQGPNWGGIIIQGKSYNNANGSNGIADDFSGVIQFVRVEFAPIALIGVGSKTVFENVMVSYVNAQFYELYQSSFSIYGGKVNCRNLISYACSGPSDFFITNGYSGNMQNLIASRHPFFGHTAGSSPGNALAGIFIQNNNSKSTALKPYTNPVISNMTVVGPDNQNGMPPAYLDTNIQAAALVTTSNACFHVRNSLLLGFPAACWILNDSNTAQNLLEGNGEFSYSIVHANNTANCFYLAPNTYRPYNSADFKNYMLGAAYHNQLFKTTAEFRFGNISNYDFGPDLMPESGSPVLTGASYDSSTFYSNPYFDKRETYLGAVGTYDWLKNWTNFIPLKTNYNFPE